MYKWHLEINARCCNYCTFPSEIFEMISIWYVTFAICFPSISSILGNYFHGNDAHIETFIDLLI